MEDLTGKKFGRLTVVGFSRLEKRSSNQYRYYWNCKCECGNEKEVLSNALRSGITQSCGCLCKERHPKKHGMSNTRLFWIWHSMKERCQNKNSRSYKYYGGKDVIVCEEWQEFNGFKEWSMKSGYKENLTIDRIDSNGNYEPENCRWVDFKVQANNTSRNHYLTINGERKTLSQWAEFFGVPYKYVHKRVHDLGWTFEEAVSRPVKKCSRKERAVE